MSRVNRMLCAAAISFLALAPITASATPTPSPSLDTLLVSPPSGYEELTSSTFHGTFTAHDYAQASNSSKADQIEKTLNHDGFVEGFGKTWIHAAAAHGMVEAVLAFTGAKGAKEWLISAEAGDKSDPTYQHSDSISGIETYYGAHVKSTDGGTEGDVFSFVKGNDVFVVALASTKDDVLQLATTQTMSQYNSAPNETIPSAQWPENQNKGFSPAYLFGFVLVPLIVIVAIAAIAFAVIRNRRRSTMTPATAGGAAGLAGGAIQMSTDGNYWWDGQAWRDASHDVQPSAQRSADGALWWDGQQWRPVPQGGEPANPPPTA